MHKLTSMVLACSLTALGCTDGGGAAAPQETGVEAPTPLTEPAEVGQLEMVDAAWPDDATGVEVSQGDGTLVLVVFNGGGDPMSTATDHERPILMDSPQRGGFLPTRWFWADRRNRRVVAWLHASIALVTISVVTIVGAHPVLAGVSLLVSLPIAQGLLEKYVRRQAMRRRALATSSDPSLGK